MVTKKNKLKKKVFWLGDKAELVYYLIYIVLSLYLRLDLLNRGVYLKIFFSIGLGLLSLFSGIKAIKEKKIRLHSIVARGKQVPYIGIFLILGAIYIMMFLR